MEYFNLFIAAVLYIHSTSAYIVPSGHEPACPILTCENGGTPNTECTCTCIDGYSGPLCESEVLPSAWPGGHYAIPTSTFGCPEDDRFGWHHGYINMTLVPGSRDIIFNDDDPLTNEPHIMGPFHTKGFQFNFCSRQGGADGSNSTWSPGNYCLYKIQESCTKGFTEGWVQMRGYTFNNTIGGALPTFETQEDNLTLWFCCRHDGESSTPITLPHTFPFVLLKGPSEQGCQKVHQMTVKEEWVFLTNENADWTWNGTLPAINRTESHVGFPFCYYRPIEERECFDVFDRGASYRGVQNVSASGNPCVVWHDIPNGGFVPDRFWTGEFDNNYCRTIGKETDLPSCYTDFNGTLEHCSVPRCVENWSLENAEDNKPIYVENFFSEYYPFYATDGTVKNYQSDRPLLKPFLQIDLQFWYEVHAIVITRNNIWFPVNLRQVGVFVSKHQWDFMDYGAVRCDDVRYPHKNTRYRFQCKRPITGQFVTIRNFDSTDPFINVGKYFYMEINEINVKAKRTYCGMQMGMISGDIFNYQLESSSQLKGEMWADYGRMGKLGEGWCPSELDSDPWFVVDLLFPTKVQGILVQGWNDGASQIILKKFTISYGIQRDNLTVYEDPIGIIKVFETASHLETTAIQRFIFQHEIYTRFIKIHPLGTSMDRCLKLEIIGCPRRIIRDEWCKHGSQDYGLEEQQYVSFWTDEGPNRLENYIYNTSIEECREKLRESPNFVSFNFGLASGEKDIYVCQLKYGSRYTQEHKLSFVVGRSRHDHVGQKFCIRDVKPYSECGGILTLIPNQTSVITSPSFPFSYGQGVECSWYITATPGKFVHLEIVSVAVDKPLMWNDVFEGGEYSKDVTICADVLHIIGDYNEKITIPYSSLKDFHGSRIISSTRELYVRLVTCIRYSTAELRRFELHVKEIDVPGCGLESAKCFVTCDSPQAYIATPRFPSDISQTDTCSWTIQGMFGQYVKLEVIVLDIADDEGTCIKTFVAVYDVSLLNQQTLLYKMCRTNRPHKALISSWHVMQIEFRAGDGAGKGFLGRYSLVDFSHQNKINNLTDNCQDGWYGVGSSCYKMMANISGLTWLEAEDTCNANGGHLLSINDINEMKTIHFLLTTIWIQFGWLEAYIGLQKIKDKDENEVYQWTDGSSLTYTAWYRDPVTLKSQPDGMWNERCTAIRLYSIHVIDGWNDIACAYNGIMSFICEQSLLEYSNSTEPRNSSTMSRALTVSAHNNTSQFTCRSGTLISKKFICDGIKNCEDGSDEERCGTDCSLTQFKCNDGRCVSISSYCDFKKDCQDGSDENNCVWPPCREGEWRCKNNQCIRQEKVCDLKNDCLDESDEEMCDECKSPNFQCYDQTCIPHTQTCDGKVDCGGLFFEDEGDMCHAATMKSCSEWYSLGVRENGEYMITAGLQSAVKVECQFLKKDDKTIIRTILHHDLEFPVSSQQEVFYQLIEYNMGTKHINAIKGQNSCFQQIRVQCHFIVDSYWINNNYQQIHLTEQSGNSQCSCPFVRNCTQTPTQRCNCEHDLHAWLQPETNEIREDTGVLTDYNDIPVQGIGQGSREMVELRKIYLTIGPLICDTETSDESEYFLCRSGITVPSKQKCLLEKDQYNGMKGCRDLSHLDNCESFQCPENYVKCPNSFCIPVHYMCDKKVHCPNGEDEEGCGGGECQGLFHCAGSNICLALSNVCDGISQCLHGDDESLCKFDCPSSCICESYSMECFGFNSCENGNISTDCEALGGHNVSNSLDENVRKLIFTNANFGADVPVIRTYFLAELVMSKCQIKALVPYQFQYLNNLYYLDLSFNELTLLERDTFFGLSNLLTLNLMGNRMLSFIDPFAFNGIAKLPKLAVNETLIHSLKANTFKGLQSVLELNLTSNNLKSIDDGSFNDLDSLKILDIRKNQIESFSKGLFQGLTGLQKLYSDAYVFCCLRPTTVSEENCLPYRDEFSSCSELMREDVLRAFVWIIGVSSLFGNFGVFIYKMFYDKKSRTRGHGVIITNLSLSDFCMGVYMLIIAIADLNFRGKYIWNDIAWRNGYVCQFAGVLATVSSEASVLFLFLITLDRFLSIKYPFGQIQMHSKTAKIACLCVWMCCVIVAVLPLLPIAYFNHKFYSRSAVCLALPLTRDRPPGWEYGTAIFICLNFLIFLCISVGQLMIYREVSSTKNIIKSTRRNQDAAIARSLFLVVFTDFLCWFPVGVMGLMALSGKMIPGDVYAWSAVFILPINSALNPYLYTFSAIWKQKGVGSWRFSSKLLRSSSSSSVFIKRDNKWTEICQSQKFLLCGPKHGTISLKMLLDTTIPSTALVFHIVHEIIEAVELLHSTSLVHGNISEECIFVSMDGDMKIYSLTIPKPNDELDSMKSDIENLGLLTKRLLKWKHMNSSNGHTLSCSKKV